MTSPPYWGLRDYGIEGQLGLEPTYQEYVQHLAEVCQEILRVLAKDGSFYLNLGDTYSSAMGRHGNQTAGFSKERMVVDEKKPPRPSNLPPKCLIGIPWRVTLLLIDQGWTLRNDIIWFKRNCMPSSVKDRLTNTYEHIFHLVKSRKYYYNLDAIRQPHKTNYSPFNIRVRDAQQGRLKAKWGDKYSATELEVAQYNEKLYAYIKEINELARRYRTTGYSGKSTEASNKGWDEVLKTARAYRTAAKEVIEKYGLAGELAAALKDYAQNHLDNYRGRNLGDVVKHDLAVKRSSNSSYRDPLHVKAYHLKGKNPGDVVYPTFLPQKGWIDRTKSGDYRQTPSSVNPRGKNPGDIVWIKERIGDAHKGEATANLYRAHATHHSMGKNPGDFWEISTRPHPFAHFAVYPEDICLRPIMSSSRVGDIVLDPFMGSGTTGVVAKKLGRNFIGIDIKNEYLQIAKKRIDEAQEYSQTHPL